MCGRYSLALRPSQVREYLENDEMPVYEAPDDDGANAPRQSYNFAPGYHGIVYRAERPNRDQHQDGETEQPSNKDHLGEGGQQEIRYKLQQMTWGLIPSWTKRNPNYGSVMKTINCRDDSLSKSGGMWTTMKQKKRCVVVAQGFYEWLKKGKEKLPHYVKRKDGAEERLYTYTIITTDPNKQLKFLHDRMPVILENGSQDLRTWLDPNRTWSKELQNLLKPFGGELDIYPVSKDVGKVGNNSPTFIVPLTSSENKSNIANFFIKPVPKKDVKISTSSKIEGEASEPSSAKHAPKDDREAGEHSGAEDNAPLPVPRNEAKKGMKRELEDVPTERNPQKVQKTTRRDRSATSNK
ncbi:DUF159-domain-containing protein [Venustampulla echinocandica]|uniref:DUF159-domain-containing protein n=1 Tax=Venustampulla echinocandica TaxID=2656787 RepID=A0A370TU43_9HELO|nr:DUF159-domain-containing protein [Venustampulla echinocandica]RDL39053.1 DUF159-domain-containing protein [Venustampulla echinocandica]